MSASETTHYQMKLSEKPALKKEILALSGKEKDKLLLRLIAKDKVLTEHFHFMLLEDADDLTQRIEALKKEITGAVGNFLKQEKRTAKQALVLLRSLMKKVNHFAKVTKKIPEEIELKIFLLNHFKIPFTAQTHSLYKDYAQIFANYVTKQTQLIVKKMDKLHPDLQFDLAEEMNKIMD